MPFPLSADGAIDIQVQTSSDLQRIITGVELAIRDAKASKITRGPQEISFRAGLFRFVSSWNQLIAISSGKIQFSMNGTRISIRYWISFAQLLVVVTLLVLVAFGVLPAVSSKEHFKPPLFVLPVAWLWLFCGNYLITIYRFPRYLRAAAEHVAQTAYKEKECK